MLDSQSRGVVAVIFTTALISGCAETHYGVYPDQTASFPARAVSVADAVAAAQPYLGTTFALRSANRQDGKDWGQPRVYVTLKGNQYHIVKENYPYIMAPAYLAHAVRVDAETGDVTPPE